METGRKELEAIREWIDAQTGEFILTVLFGKGEENDILVAQRQKHNGMSWSKNGSGSLAAIKMVFQNGYEDIWFRQEQISFTISGSKPLDLCA